MYAIGQAVLAFGAVGNGDQGIKNFPNMWGGAVDYSDRIDELLRS